MAYYYSDSSSEKATILVVDDTPETLSFISEILKEHYKVKIANNGKKALSIAYREIKPDIILLDIVMPSMDGYEVCRLLKENPATKNIPVIFLTSSTDTANEERGFELGAVDYITKPVSVPILLARISAQLHLKSAADFIRDKNAYLEKEVLNRTLEVRAIQDVTIWALASLAETRDNETGNHIKRTQLYVKCLAIKLKENPKFTHILTPAFIETLYKSAPLHDIGKVGISDLILLKPGPLTKEEFEIMKTHTTIGYTAIENAEKQLDISVDFLSCSKEIAYSHHEKWNGSGYPLGCSGEEIPLSARIMAIVDVYDALTTKRVYKEALAHNEALKIIASGKGTHFDPDIVDVFLDSADDFSEIALQYKE